tara:strand:- start:5695 stop:6642 length:948 start_codon:yes stop_codon:yes gene_type:complete
MDTLKNIISKTKTNLFGREKESTSSLFKNSSPSLATSGIRNLKKSLNSVKNTRPLDSVKKNISSSGNSIMGFTNSLKSNFSDDLKTKLTGNSNNIKSAVLSPINEITEKTKQTFNNLTPQSFNENATFRTASVSNWFSGNIFIISILILIMAFLGLNIFTYLAKGTDIISYFLSETVKELPEKTKDVTKNTLSGINLGTDILSGMVKNTTNVVSGQLDINESKNNRRNNRRNERRDHRINNKKVRVQNLKEKEKKKDYKENTEDNKIQENKKPGYCYIGSDRGYRSCIKINSPDECQSKNIFPTKEVCINPNLRV